MHRSYFDGTPYHLLKHKSESYWFKEGNWTPALTDVNTGITVSNGGLKCPVGDFLKYLNFLMGDPDQEERYDTVLKRSSLEEMFQPRIEVDEGETPPGRNRKDFQGLTFFIEENEGKRYLCHSGSQNAYITHFYLDPESRTAYVAALNTTSRDPSTSTREVDRKIKIYLFDNIFPLYK
jgi:hypothetical protein